MADGLEGAGADSVVYWLDASDRIIAVNEAWNAFAQANGGDDLLGNTVVGQHLLGFVVDDKTRLVIDSCLRVVRFTGRPRDWSYRCDSPWQKRYQQMTIVPKMEAVLRVEHVLLRTEPISPSLHFYGGRHGKLVPRCSICNSLRHHDFWYDGSELAEPVTLTNPIPVAYTVCPVCEDAAVDS